MGEIKRLGLAQQLWRHGHIGHIKLLSQLSKTGREVRTFAGITGTAEIIRPPEAATRSRMALKAQRVGSNSAADAGIDPPLQRFLGLVISWRR